MIKDNLFKKESRWFLNPLAPARCFLLLIFLIGLPLCVLTPPFQTTDEPLHYYRAYQISEGRLLCKRQGGQVGGELPASISQWVQTAQNDLLGGQIFGASHFQYQALSDHALMPLDQDHRIFLAFNNSAFYPPVVYVPQALGMAIGRWFGGGPVPLFYLGRLFNLLFYIALVYLALRTTPVMPWTLFLIGAMPICLYQAASLNPDAANNALHFLFWAQMLAVGWGPISERKTAALGVVGLAGLLGLTKGYGFILLPCFVVPVPFETKGRWLWISSVLGSYAIMAGLWVYLNNELMVFTNPAINPWHQLKYMMGHPMVFIKALLWAWNPFNLVHYARSCFGVLGWIHIHIPYWITILYLAWLLISISVDSKFNVLSVAFRKLSLFAFVLGALSVFLWIYVTNNPVGSPQVRGVQGRYFIPLIPMLVFVLPRFNYPPDLSKIFHYGTCGLVLLAGISMWVLLIAHYYINHHL